HRVRAITAGSKAQGSDFAFRWADRVARSPGTARGSDLRRGEWGRARREQGDQSPGCEVARTGVDGERQGGFAIRAEGRGGLCRGEFCASGGRRCAGEAIDSGSEERYAVNRETGEAGSDRESRSDFASCRWSDGGARGSRCGNEPGAGSGRAEADYRESARIP